MKFIIETKKIECILHELSEIDNSMENLKLAPFKWIRLNIRKRRLYRELDNIRPKRID